MLIKDKNGNIDYREMTEIIMFDLDKKLDTILTYCKKVESSKRIDRYVDERLTRGRTTNLTTLQNTSNVLPLGGKTSNNVKIMLIKFLLRMAQEWKCGVLLIDDIHREFYDYLDKIDKYEDFHTSFNKNHKSISEMIEAVHNKHKEIESIDKSED